MDVVTLGVVALLALVAGCFGGLWIGGRRSGAVASRSESLANELAVLRERLVAREARISEFEVQVSRLQQA